MPPPPPLSDDPGTAHEIAQRAYLELSTPPPTFADPSFFDNYVPLKSRPVKDQIDQLNSQKAHLQSTEIELRDNAIISNLGAELRQRAQLESALVEHVCVLEEVGGKRESKAILEAGKADGQKYIQAQMNERQAIHYKYLTMMNESRLQSIADLRSSVDKLETLLRNSFPRSETDFDELNRVDQQMGLEVAKYLSANTDVRQSMMSKYGAERGWRDEDAATLVDILDKNPDFQTKVKTLVESKSAGPDPRRGRK